MSAPISIRYAFVPLGWDHAAWAGRYYPEDLPADWRLSYFANEFPGVSLEPDAWIDVPDEVVSGWAQSVPQRFRFYPLLPAEAPAFDLQGRLHLFRDRLGGVGAMHPVEEAGMADVRTYRWGSLEDALAGRVWGNTLAIGLQTGGLGDLRHKRGILEHLQLSLPPGTRVLGVLKGRPPDLDELRQLEQLALLLGLS